ncbi:hypothetical protein CU097_004579, partial [Rhizopus azygosporus]
GESAGDSQDASDSPGFEVDLRVVKDTMSRRRKEADKAKVEIARFNPSMIKITNDRTKLLIESKTTLVKLIKEVPEKNKDYCYPWSTDHSKATLFSLKLGANGLYVEVKEGVTVPHNHIARIKEFREVIMLLFKLKARIKELYSIIKRFNEFKRMQ